MSTGPASPHDDLPEAADACLDPDSGRLGRWRLRLLIAVLLVIVAVAMLLEQVLELDRTQLVTLAYLAEVVACLIALRASALPTLSRRSNAVAAGLAASLSLMLTIYVTVVGGNLERVATSQVCLLSALVVLLPWNWRAQLAVSMVSLGGVGGAAFYLNTSPASMSYAFFVLAIAITTSVFGSFFLSRYRRDVMRHTTMLARASTQAAEEAEVAEALLHVGDVLNAHLDQPDLLQHVTSQAVELVGTDWGATFVWDESRNAYRLHASVGVSTHVVDELEQVDSTPGSLPIVRAHRPGLLLELPDAREQELVPPDMLARWQVSSELCAPISRGVGVIGLICLGYRTRTGPFSPRQRRLALGIAHVTAVAFENARLIERLQAASRLKSEFVSTISHELRTPLNVILGFAEMARDSELPLYERERCLERLEGAGRELLTLIESTLEVGRIDAGRDDVRLEPVPLRVLWAQLERICASLPHDAAVAVVWSADVPDVSLVTDPRKLTIVLRNLVGNALKFTSQGVVRVDARADDERVVITVEDTGIGIRAEDCEGVFEMFRQADGSDSRRYGGTGLGLYIVRRFVTQLGGTVALSSVYGEGSTFTVSLPRTAAGSGVASTRAA
jgi:signal transduction histidine kinase